MGASGSKSGKIGMLAASVIGINAMVGIGVITIPSMLSLKVGPAGIISYALSVLIVVALGIALGRVALRYPGEGWTYLYPSRWAGHAVGMFSAVSYLVGVLVAMGFLIQQAGIWANQFIPSFQPTTLGLTIILILMVLVMAGAEASSIGQYIIAGCVTIPLIATALVCWSHFNPGLLSPFVPHGTISIFSAAPKALFALLGFECIVSLYSVVDNPSKNVPRAFMISILFVGGLYLFFTAGLLSSIHPSYFSAGLDATLATVLHNAFPAQKILSTAVLVGAMFGIIGTLHSMLWSASALFTDTLKRARSPFVTGILDRGIWDSKVSTAVSTAVMIFSSFVFHAEVLIDLTDLLLIFPSVLAIMALFFIPEEWKRGRNIVTIIGMFGGCLMLYFAGEEFVKAFFALF
ncbi:APC family permease [Candidatus Dependentiae bacterium]|nr:APC family permease [Candidatus Dependentiae bacterium]